MSETQTSKTDPPEPLTHKPPVVRRVLTFLLGTDQPAFVITASVVALAFGIFVIGHAVIFSDRAAPPLWQTIGGGLAIGLLFLPFFFIAISRATLTMPPWVALATLTAILPCPILLWRLGEAGVNPFVTVFGCVAFVLAVFFTARAIVKRRDLT